MNSLFTTIQSWFRNAITYFAEAFTRIFGLDDDEYPKTGVQPYSGDPSHEH
jgi:hypothetical protein